MAMTPEEANAERRACRAIFVELKKTAEQLARGVAQFDGVVEKMVDECTRPVLYDVASPEKVSNDLSDRCEWFTHQFQEGLGPAFETTGLQLAEAFKALARIEAKRGSR